MQFHSLYVHQTFPRPRVVDVREAVLRQLNQPPLADKIRPGQTVAITAGSRGIRDIQTVLRAMVEHCKNRGGRPFIVPSMGSHGGATETGQLDVLHRLGISEASIGCPIRSTMNADIVAHTQNGIPIAMDRFAAEADHVILCGRVKPHTSIRGPFESGLMKMLLVGLGNAIGAQTIHRELHHQSFESLVHDVGRDLIKVANVLCGVAIIENAQDETALIEAVPGPQILKREPELLRQAAQWMARLPFDDIDVLLIDQIGKNISGTGMDTNVVGRKSNDHAALNGETPRIKRIAVRRLTDETGGNATGIGIAEFCRDQLVDKIDTNITNLNCLTASHPMGAMIPMHFASDHEMLHAAFGTVGALVPADVRWVWIRDTRSLTRFECSTNFADEIASHPDLEVVATRTLAFDQDGNLGWFGLD